MSRIKLLAASLIILLTSLPICAATRSRYSGGEHMFLGNSLHINLQGDGITETSAKFQLSNGATISYGELVSMGDFFRLRRQSYLTRQNTRRT